MNGFLSELMPPGDSGSLCWLCCQHCRRLKDCPYVYDQILRRAACQGREAAQNLNSEAGRVLEKLSLAGGASCLLDDGAALERALSQALDSEMALISRLCAQMGERCPRETGSSGGFV